MMIPQYTVEHTHVHVPCDILQSLHPRAPTLVGRRYQGQGPDICRGHRTARNHICCSQV